MYYSYCKHCYAAIMWNKDDWTHMMVSLNEEHVPVPDATFTVTNFTALVKLRGLVRKIRNVTDGTDVSESPCG